MSPAPAQPTAEVKSTRWDSWRGSPQLLAQIARTGLLAAAEAGEDSPRCTIDVSVGAAHEVFDSPGDLVAHVTQDALRRFTSVSIRVHGTSLSVEVAFRWLRPWWKPGMSTDAEVVLEVHGDGGQAEEAIAQLEASIVRGIPVVKSKWATTAGAFLGPIVGGAGVGNALFLLKVSGETATVAVMVAAVAGLVLGAVVGTWIWPSLEVAPLGQARIRRVVRVVGPILLALVLSGITKALYG